jgi:hypothetical protein
MRDQPPQVRSTQREAASTQHKQILRNNGLHLHSVQFTFQMLHTSKGCAKLRECTDDRLARQDRVPALCSVEECARVCECEACKAQWVASDGLRPSQRTLVCFFLCTLQGSIVGVSLLRSLLGLQIVARTCAALTGKLLNFASLLRDSILETPCSNPLVCTTPAAYVQQSGSRECVTKEQALALQKLRGTTDSSQQRGNCHRSLWQTLIHNLRFTAQAEAPHPELSEPAAPATCQRYSDRIPEAWPSELGAGE